MYFSLTCNVSVSIELPSSLLCLFSDISELYIVISFIGRDSGSFSRCLFHCDIIETIPLIRWLLMLVFQPPLVSPR